MRFNTKKAFGQGKYPCIKTAVSTFGMVEVLHAIECVCVDSLNLYPDMLKERLKQLIVFKTGELLVNELSAINPPAPNNNIGQRNDHLVMLYLYSQQLGIVHIDEILFPESVDSIPLFTDEQIKEHFDKYDIDLYVDENDDISNIVSNYTLEMTDSFYEMFGVYALCSGEPRYTMFFTKCCLVMNTLVKAIGFIGIFDIIQKAKLPIIEAETERKLSTLQKPDCRELIALLQPDDNKNALVHVNESIAMATHLCVSYIHNQILMDWEMVIDERRRSGDSHQRVLEISKNKNLLELFTLIDDFINPDESLFKMLRVRRRYFEPGRVI